MGGKTGGNPAQSRLLLLRVTACQKSEHQPLSFVTSAEREGAGCRLLESPCSAEKGIFYIYCYISRVVSLEKVNGVYQDETQ